MRVLMLGWEFPPQITGGLGTACYGITKSLAKQSINILFVVPKAFGNEDGQFVTIQDAGEIPFKYQVSGYKKFWERVKYIEVAAKLFPYLSHEDQIKKPKQQVSNITSPGNYTDTDFIPFSGNYGTDLWNEIDRYSIVTSIMARNESFDIIHAHEWLTFPAAISAKKISDRPLIVHIHATEFDRNGRNISKNVFDIEKKGMEIADKVIAVSNYTRNIIINQYGIHPPKVVTIHNGVDRNAALKKPISRKHPNIKTVTFLGRLTFQKGPEYFIDAAYKVLTKQDNVRFVMAGSGDLKDKIEQKLKTLGISSHFSLPGFLKQDEIRKLFSETDLYVMPSVSEPFGISSLEALQAGVPVIISKQSGVAEVIRNAIKVDYWDIDALSDAIYAVLNYKPLSKFMSSKGIKEVNKLNWDKAGKQILNVYKSLV